MAGIVLSAPTMSVRRNRNFWQSCSASSSPAIYLTPRAWTNVAERHQTSVSRPSLDVSMECHCELVVSGSSDHRGVGSAAGDGAEGNHLLVRGVRG
jgi:hypothetical protein